MLTLFWNVEQGDVLDHGRSKAQKVSRFHSRLTKLVVSVSDFGRHVTPRLETISISIQKK